MSRARSVSRSSSRYSHRSRSNSHSCHPSPIDNNHRNSPVFPSAQPHIQQTPFQFTAPSPFSNGTSLTPESLLRYWPWVDNAHLSTISHGTFEINNLTKLLRDEDARRNHVTGTINGIVTDIHTGKQKVMI